MVAQLVRKMPQRLQRWLLRTISWWPPFLGAGIRVEEISDDFLRIRSSMRLTWFNRNYVNTHFGGSIYSMTDPFYMLMLIQHLGSEYVVWDVAAQVQFRSPGLGKLSAEFEFTLEELERIRAAADARERLLVKKRIEVKDEAGNVVAKVRKTMYVRRKRDRGLRAAARAEREKLLAPSLSPSVALRSE